MASNVQLRHPRFLTGQKPLAPPNDAFWREETTAVLSASFRREWLLLQMYLQIIQAENVGPYDSHDLWPNKKNMEIQPSQSMKKHGKCATWGRFPKFLQHNQSGENIATFFSDSGNDVFFNLPSKWTAAII